jgi:hypothetical protein
VEVPVAGVLDRGGEAVRDLGGVFALDDDRAAAVRKNPSTGSAQYSGTGWIQTITPEVITPDWSAADVP